MPATGNKSFTSFRLSIRLASDGLSFSVLNTFGGQTVQTDRFPVHAPEEVADVLRQALQKPYLMDYHFQSVEVEADTPTTIVPLEHFNRSDMLAYYRLCFPSNGQWSAADGQRPRVSGGWAMADMHYQIVSSLEIVLVFRLGQGLLNIVQECYPDVKVCCSDARMLEHFAALQEKRPAAADDGTHSDTSGDRPQCNVYLHVARHRFFIAAFRRTGLLYAASQAAADDDDRAFLVLGIWKAIGLQAQRDTIHLEGASKQLRKTLSEYILNIEA